MADPNAGQQAVIDYLKSLGIDPNAIGGGANAQATDPFAGQTGQAMLYRGSKLDPHLPGGFPAKVGATKSYNMIWGGKSVVIRAPDLGPDVHIAINSTIGENPSQEDIRKAPPTSQVRIWIELRGKDNKVLYEQGIDSAAVGDGLGRFAQDVNTQTLLGRGGVTMRAAGSPDVLLDIDPYKDPHGGSLGVQVDDTGTIEDEIKSLYKMKPEEIRKYKTQLWLAGYYGRDTPLDAVNMSVLGSDDIKSFTDIMLQASRYWNSGQKVTWQGLLAMQAADPSNAKQGQKTNVQPIELTDPAAITAEANKTGKQLLGRNPSPGDVMLIIQAIHNKETVLGTARNDQQGGTVQGVAPASDIEEYFRKKYPQETMAVDWGAAAADWEQMLRTPAGQPGTVTPVPQNR